MNEREIDELMEDAEDIAENLFDLICSNPSTVGLDGEEVLAFVRMVACALLGTVHLNCHPEGDDGNLELAHELTKIYTDAKRDCLKKRESRTSN